MEFKELTEKDQKIFEDALADLNKSIKNYKLMEIETQSDYKMPKENK